MLNVLAFSFWYLPSGLLWAALCALNYWVWRRSKSSGHLVMLLGSAWLAQHNVLAAFEMCVIGTSNYGLDVALGSTLFVVGFYLSVKPLVADDLSRLWRGVRGKLAKSGSAPSAPPAKPAAPPAPTPFFKASSPGIAAAAPASATSPSAIPASNDLKLR